MRPWGLAALLVAAGCGAGTDGTPAAPLTTPAPAPEPPPPEPSPEPGPGTDIFDFPMRAISISGYWGTNRRVVQPWEDAGGAGPLIPEEYVSWLRGMHANWILISVGLHYDDSMDSTVSREPDRNRNVPTWRDDSLRRVIREFREHGFDVYVTLAFEAHEAEKSVRPVQRWQLGDPAPRIPAAFRTRVTRGQIAPENWPWRPDHPDHQRFVRRVLGHLHRAGGPLRRHRRGRGCGAVFPGYRDGRAVPVAP